MPDSCVLAPVVFVHSALEPMAVFDVPVLFKYRAVNPRATLEVPDIL